MQDLSDACVLVTGARGRLGQAVVAALAGRGATVVANDLEAPAEPSPAALWLPGDVSQEAVVRGLFEALAERELVLTALVNNAGIISNEPLADCSLAAWRRMFAVNVEAALLCAQYAFRECFRPRRGGSVVHMGSINGKVPRWENAAYCVSKATLSALTRSMALEWAADGVRVNTLSPGSCGGPMASAHYEPDVAEQRLLHGDLSRYRLGVPMGRLCSPEDVAQAAAFLISPGAGHITGQELFVDGGQSIF